MNVPEMLLRLTRRIERNEARIAAGDRVVMENLRCREQLPREVWERVEPELRGFVRDMCQLFRHTIQLRATRDQLRRRMQ